MGKLTLDVPVEGIVPLNPVEAMNFPWAFRLSPKGEILLNPHLKLVLGPALQMGGKDATTDSGLRFFRLLPDPRLQLGNFSTANSEFRLDVPEAYIAIAPNKNWQIRVGRNYWDNTLQRRFRDWSAEGFTDGNIADAGISLGFGGDVRFSKPWTKSFPVDLQLSASAAVGANREALGLVQGLATFSLFPKSPDSVTVVGGSLSVANYPGGSLPKLLPGIPENMAGSALSASAYLQQGIGSKLDIQVGYGDFIPIREPNDANLTALKGRQGLSIAADLHGRLWGLHANYGRVWRDDLALSNTRVHEDILGLSGRWMVLGDQNRVLNLTLGGTTALGPDHTRWSLFVGVELSLRKIHL